MKHSPDLSKVPAELKALRRWVPWRYVRRGTRLTKMPLQSTTRPECWLSVSEACDSVARGGADGVGFVVGDGIVGSDLDHCIGKDGTLNEVARDAVDLGSYVERSPSGDGLHIWIKGTILESRKIGGRNGDPRREIYDGRPGSARYLTVTGDRVGDATELRGGPDAQVALDAFYAKWFGHGDERAERDRDREIAASTLSDDAVLQLMFGSKNGAKWRRLFDGDCSGYPSQSEAEFALCRKLRFFTRANVTQIDRLFRRSGLMRAKWDQRRGDVTYGERTIKKALLPGGRLYKPPSPVYRVATTAGRHGKIHDSVMPVLSRLSRTEILAYVALAIHADGDTGEGYPSATTVARLIGTTREHAQSAITKLDAVELAVTTPRPGKTSIFRLPAFAGVSKFDTGRGQPDGRPTVQKATQVRERRKRARRKRPVSEFDTPPVAKFDTQTDKEQNIDTGDEGDGASFENEPLSEAELDPFPEPCIPLTASARLLRDDMLRGPVGRLFLDGPLQKFLPGVS